jgi:hypothetical protein
MTDYCTGVDCCLTVDILRTTIHAKFLLDTCKYKLTMGIERLEEEVLLLDYEWGLYIENLCFDYVLKQSPKRWFSKAKAKLFIQLITKTMCKNDVCLLKMSIYFILFFTIIIISY